MPIKYTEKVKPVCLPLSQRPPAASAYAGQYGTVVGWGKPSHNEAKGFGVETPLQEVSMEIWDNDKCRSAYQMDINENVLCAGGQGKDTCIVRSSLS